MPGTLGSLTVQQTALVGALLVDFAMQMAGWVVSSILVSDRFFDMLGTSAFLVVAVGTLIYGGYYKARQILVTVAVALWALRLGGFLVYRVFKVGHDSRFDEIKTKPAVFFNFWAGQTVWVWVTCLPVMALNGTSFNPGLQWSDILGGILWVVGWLMQATADFQKLFFKNNPANKGKYIDTGLWALSRHPNYCGEMMMWWGVWFMCLAIMRGGYYATIVSPLIVMAILNYATGVPIQEKQAEERWGNLPAFQEYKRRTNLYIPLPNLYRLRGKKGNGYEPEGSPTAQ